VISAPLSLTTRSVRHVLDSNIKLLEPYKNSKHTGMLLKRTRSYKAKSILTRMIHTMLGMPKIRGDTRSLTIFLHPWHIILYMVSLPMQAKICTKRAYQRLRNDKASTLTVVLGQIIMALVVGSVFFRTLNKTNSFFARRFTLFFATLLNALITVTEINSLYQ
jgi:hypothetical protein